jgi:hypothetical protein
VGPHDTCTLLLLLVVVSLLVVALLLLLLLLVRVQAGLGPVSTTAAAVSKAATPSP